jgi:hypothetical protein
MVMPSHYTSKDKKKTSAGAPGKGRMSLNKDVKFDAKYGGKASTAVKAKSIAAKQGPAAAEAYKKSVAKKSAELKREAAAKKKK